MQNTTDTLNRWELVSSLYGPGTFWSWLCIVASVVISWTINPTTAQSDSITNDLIAALTLPVVGAADSLYQLAKYGCSDRTPIFFSHKPEDLQLAAALEAPLAICEVYVVLALFLHSTATRKHQWKRMGCVILTTILCFSPELVVFFMYPNLPVSISTFARPFLFNFVIELGFISGIMAIMVGIWIIRIVVVTVYHKATPNNRNQGFSEHRYTRLENWSNLSAGIIIGLAISTIKSGYVGNPQSWTTPHFTLPTRILRFTPKSNIPLTDLDQIVALSGGIITLVFSIYDAVKGCQLIFRNNGANHIEVFSE